MKPAYQKRLRAAACAAAVGLVGNGSTAAVGGEPLSVEAALQPLQSSTSIGPGVPKLMSRLAFGNRRAGRHAAPPSTGGYFPGGDLSALPMPFDPLNGIESAWPVDRGPSFGSDSLLRFVIEPEPAPLFVPPPPPAPLPARAG